MADVYPSVKFFRKFSRIGFRVKRLQKESDEILHNIINPHKIAASGAKDDVDECSKEEDLVDVLLKYHNSRGELNLTMENIKAVLLDLFSGGIETSSITVDWAMVEMLRNPSVMKKAQDEVRQVFDEKGTVDESCFDRLNYLKLVIKETLRMHPPVPLLLRENRDACEIDGYHIPARTRLFVNAWALNRDPNYWKEPESFKPERYLDLNIDFMGNDFEYLPFGGGRRICPGITFGLVNVEYQLALFLYHFDWALPRGMKPDEMDMKESFSATSRRKSPLHVIPMVNRTLPVI